MVDCLAQMSQRPEISSKQEEADTKMFLCATFAASLGFHSVNIVNVNTNVAILSFYFQLQMNVNYFLQMDTGARERIYEISSNDLSEEVLMVLPAIHVLSGCDSTSLLVGIVKVKMYNTVCSKERFLEAARLLGVRETISDNLLGTIKELFCCLYGFKQESSINECRYGVLVQRNKIPEQERFPPTKDAL